MRSQIKLIKLIPFTISAPLCREYSLCCQKRQSITRTISALTSTHLPHGWRKATIVKCLTQGHKCHDRDSNQRTLLLTRNTRAWVRCSYSLGHDTHKNNTNNDKVALLLSERAGGTLHFKPALNNDPYLKEFLRLSCSSHDRIWRLCLNNLTLWIACHSWPRCILSAPAFNTSFKKTLSSW